MSVSSIFAVTITLILIAVIGVIAINIQDMTYSIEDNLTIYAKVDRELTDKQAQKIQPQIEKIAGVKKVTSVSYTHLDVYKRQPLRQQVIYQYSFSISDIIFLYFQQ